MLRHVLILPDHHKHTTREENNEDTYDNQALDTPQGISVQHQQNIEYRQQECELQRFVFHLSLRFRGFFGQRVKTGSTEEDDAHCDDVDKYFHLLFVSQEEAIADESVFEFATAKSIDTRTPVKKAESLSVHFNNEYVYVYKAKDGEGEENYQENVEVGEDNCDYEVYLTAKPHQNH